jgi:uncharacterized protein
VRLAMILIATFLALAGAAAAGPLEDGEAVFQRGDYATALKLWRPLADQGNAAAQDAIGSMYSDGQGVPQDFVEALKWYRQAADQGDAGGQFSLGIMYDFGQGVPQNYAEAAKWYCKAAEQGHDKAQFNLGFYTTMGKA